MANRNNTFLLKRSNIAGKVPAGGSLLLGELGLNTADVILYTSGTTANSIIPIGWDRVARTGDTMSGGLFTPYLSASTISATTYYNLPTDIYTTGGTYNNGNIYLTNNTGGTFVISGLTDSVPTILNKSEITSATTVSDNFNTGIRISGSAITNSYVGVSINGLNVEVGDGVITSDCYFSSNGNSSGVRYFSAITVGDYFMWNTIISGYELDNTDKVSFYYNISQ